MADAPAFRIWPPVALGVPLLTGLIITAVAGDPVTLPAAPARWVGFGLCALFAAWNGWALQLMAAGRTALLPGGATRAILDRGPFAVSRNPLYLGMIALDAGIALLWPSIWALLFVPIGVALVLHGAIRPEEAYLGRKFGAEYDDYRDEYGAGSELSRPCLARR